jgi:hypothetical protein
MEARAAGEGGVPAGVESGLDDAFLAPPKNQAWQDAWTISEAIILKMDELTSRIGGKLMLVGLTMGIQVHPDPGFRATLEKKLGVGDLFYPNTRLAEFARKHGIRALMPAAEMQRFAETHKAFLHGFKNANNVGGGHWNEAGHRLAAEIIARDLCANPL